jgi:hypothetical protein
MAVLVEATSVIVRRDAIEARYSGGWDAFICAVPNQTLCCDDELARIGFMCPPDVKSFVDHLREKGLRFVEDGKAVDIAIVDQHDGPITKCEWLEIGKIQIAEKVIVSACWFRDSKLQGHGPTPAGSRMRLQTPIDWKYVESISRDSVYIPSDEVKSRLIFLRSENGVDAALDLETWEVIYKGRTSRP